MSYFHHQRVQNSAAVLFFQGEKVGNQKLLENQVTNGFYRKKSKFLNVQESKQVSLVYKTGFFLKIAQ